MDLHTDLHQRVLCARSDCIDDGVDRESVVQEVLPEALARDVCHQRPSRRTPIFKTIPYGMRSAPSQRRLAHLDVDALAQLPVPLGIGFFVFLLAQHVAGLLSLLPGVE